MFGIADETLFKPRIQPQQPLAMPSPIAGAVGVGDPTQLQPQATNATPPPALTLPSPTSASNPAPVPTKRAGPQWVGGAQGLV